jgi:hypothetical protein
LAAALILDQGAGRADQLNGIKRLRVQFDAARFEP